jgi:hypothetical protein
VKLKEEPKEDDLRDPVMDELTIALWDWTGLLKSYYKVSESGAQAWEYNKILTFAIELG